MRERAWQRALADDGEGRIDVPLRFRVVPGTWPEIAFAPADGTRDEVAADAYEVHLRWRPGPDGTLRFDIGGCRGQLTSSEPASSVVTLVIADGRGELRVDDGEPLVIPVDATAGLVAASAVTDNVAGFRLASRPPAAGWIELGAGAELLAGSVYGLRETSSAMYERAAAEVELGELLFRSDRFTVHDGGVVEGDHAALVPDARTIVSPLRVLEEFDWRDNGLGDMTRVVDRGELWRSAVEPGRFPRLTTSFRSVDAAFELALETFQRNASSEFALPGETGLWSAGYFQGPGLGFGVWRRDTAHIALRGGTLLDPAVARASLARIVDAGFDNGSDGDALPAVAIWDYVQATGDESLARESWPSLIRSIEALDARFDEARGLIRAPQSTSNDLFDEPESGGFALSTEVYAMQSYASMAKMAALADIDESRGTDWARRAESMRRSIVDEYWDAGRGYWTSGPRGSTSSEAGNWETSGAEAALWGFLGAEAEERSESVLRALDAVAMSEFGVVLFPYREPRDHFTGTVWYCWQAGIARAAARVGDGDLVRRLIAQQVRTVVRNKTFYEVTEAATGESWRWPGQLWHAAGFASLILFGLFGLTYDVDGLRFTPAVAPEFDGATLTGLRYRAAHLDIEIRGSGSTHTVLLDGQPVERVPADLTGRHSLVLAVR